MIELIVVIQSAEADIVKGYNDTGSEYIGLIISIVKE